MLICTTSADGITPETSPRYEQLVSVVTDEALHSLDGPGGSQRRSSARLAKVEETAKRMVQPSKPTTSVGFSVSAKKKEEKYMGIGVVVDTKDESKEWHEARIIDANPTARLLKVHYLGWHKRYDAWVPIDSIVGHGSRVKGATVSYKSLRLTNMRATLFRLNPNYVEKSPNKPPSTTEKKKDVLVFSDKKESATSVPEKVSKSPSATTRRVSPRTTGVLEERKSKELHLKSNTSKKPHETTSIKTETKTTATSASQARGTSQRVDPKHSKNSETKDASTSQALTKTKNTSKKRKVLSDKGVEEEEPKNARVTTQRIDPKLSKHGKAKDASTSQALTKTKNTSKKRKVLSDKGVEVEVPKNAKKADNSAKTDDSTRATSVVSPMPTQALTKPQKQKANPLKRESDSKVDNTAQKRARIEPLDTKLASLKLAKKTGELKSSKDGHKPLSKSALAEIFRHRVREQQLSPLPPKQPQTQRCFPHEMNPLRKQVRNANLMYMQQQDAYLRDSIQRWTAIQQTFVKDIKSVVLL
ncbi:unnamed protein product [Aphanomyces euteiches]